MCFSCFVSQWMKVCHTDLLPVGSKHLDNGKAFVFHGDRTNMEKLALPYLVIKRRFPFFELSASSTKGFG